LRQALIKLNIAVVLWGFTGILGRWISLDPVLLVGYRMLITVVSLWVIDRFERKIERVPAASLPAMLGTGAILGLHWVAFFASVQVANVSVALICLSSAGLFTAILEPLITRTRIKPTDILLGLMALLGIALLFHFDGRYQSGILLGVASALLIAFIPILNKQHLQRYNNETVTFYNLGGGLLAVLLLLPFYHYAAPIKYFLPTGTDWWCLLALSWLCTVYTWRLSMAALRKVSAFTMNLVLNLEPVYGVLMAFVFFKEYKDLGPFFYAGFLLIFAAVLLQVLRIVKNKTT
jgi:drug/metabolite transporter (DMT)-like permease